jgi:hypothetical protein
MLDIHSLSETNIKENKCNTVNKSLTGNEPNIGFVVLMAVTMKSTVFWVVIPCSLDI